MKPLHRSAPYFCLAFLAVPACRSNDTSEPNENGAPVLTLVPEHPIGFRAHDFRDIAPVEVTTPPEKRWRARGPAKMVTAADLEYMKAHAPRPPGPADAEETAGWTDAQWMAAMRPVMFRDGIEYELAESDGEYLTRLRNAKRYQLPSEPIETSARAFVSDDLKAQDVVYDPYDDRLSIGPNALTTNEYKPVGVMNSLSAGGVHGTSSWAPEPEGSCTLTVVGPSTAVTSAHCYYAYGAGWFSTREWAFGTWNNLGTRQYLYGYASCYSVTIPSGWASDDLANVTWDFAVVEFSGCGLTPGFSLGNYGYYEPSDVAISSVAPKLTGYPQHPPVGAAYQWPSEYTHNPGSAGYAWPETSGYGPIAVATTLDGSGGQSGALITQTGSGGGRMGIAVFKGLSPLPGGFHNWARRIDSTVTSFWAANSAL